jgi:hypothetical protein
LTPEEVGETMTDINEARTYFVARRGSHGLPYQLSVTGWPVPNPYGVHLFVHKIDTGWRVSEAVTGAAVGHAAGTTVEDAIRKAFAYIDSKGGTEAVQSRVGQFSPSTAATVEEVQMLATPEARDAE